MLCGNSLLKYSVYLFCITIKIFTVILIPQESDDVVLRCWDSCGVTNYVHIFQM